MFDAEKMSGNGVSDIYAELKKRIVRREFSPDVKINQNQLAKELGVSRTPVIKALHMLNSDGLVDNIPNKGFYVHELSLQDTIELFELRQAVEMVAAANVAEYAPLEDICELGKIFMPFANSPTINAAEYAEADRQFHDRLIELSRNEMLHRVNQFILLLPKAYISGLLRSPKETLQEHFSIVDVMIQRDTVQSQALIQNHLTLTLKSLKSAKAEMLKIGIDPSKIAISKIGLD